MTLVSVEFLLTLADYNAWGRDRILQAASNLSQEQFIAPAGLDHSSVQETLVHMLASQILLLERWKGLNPQHIRPAEDFPTFQAVVEGWRQQNDALLDFLRCKSDADLLQQFEYTSRSGQRWVDPLWQSVFQLMNHETQHRSEIALVLTQMGHSPGFLDFAAFTHGQ